MDEKTVVGWNDSLHARVALDWAVARERSRKGRLRIVRVVDDSAGDYDASSLQDALKEAKKAVKAEVARLAQAAPRVEVSGEVVHGEPARELGRFSNPKTLLVVGTRERGGPSARFAWSIGARLGGVARGPIAIIPTEVDDTRTGVVVGVDETATSKAAAVVAAAEATRLGAELTVVHVWTDPPVWQEAYVPNDDFIAWLERQHGEVLDAAIAEIAKANPGLRIRRVLARNPLPAWELREESRGAAMLVLGNRGRRGLTRLLLGSVSHTIVLNIEVPTIIVGRSAG
ncbi:universal stress protein [Lacisediminihabitans sp.]|uniref:universal stress protein n=1 Tax=Lacisediminihabitans sp. TaxID=2787631 RepID=UPI00374D4622